VAGETGGNGGTGIDTTVPHSARIWNYWLGGKDNYAVDRMAGDQTIAVLPEIVDIARGTSRARGTWTSTAGWGGSRVPPPWLRQEGGRQ
jgi:hypothetical protein